MSKLDREITVTDQKQIFLERFEACLVLCAAGSGLARKFRDIDADVSEREVESLGGWDAVNIRDEECEITKNIDFLIEIGNLLRYRSNFKHLDVWLLKCAELYQIIGKNHARDKAGVYDEIACQAAEQLHPMNQVNGWHIPFNKKAWTPCPL